MPPWLEVLLGGLIGFFCGVPAMLLVLLALADMPADDLSGRGVFAVVVLVPMLLPAPLLLFRPTRMWAVGAIIGAGVTCIALAGTCALILDVLSGSH